MIHDINDLMQEAYERGITITEVSLSASQIEQLKDECLGMFKKTLPRAIKVKTLNTSFGSLRIIEDEN